jgi:hypothetical protein
MSSNVRQRRTEPSSLPANPLPSTHTPVLVGKGTEDEPELEHADGRKEQRLDPVVIIFHKEAAIVVRDHLDLRFQRRCHERL